MASGSLTVKSKNAGPGSSLRITPSNSPGLRAPRSPNKTSLHQSTLSLRTVIGTTATDPNGFSSHDQSRSFALCAGSAAILAELDDENNVNQRFFKARPSASSINPVTSFYNQSTPPSTPDTRAKSISNIRANAHSNTHNGSPSSDLAETNSPRSWSSRERIKAVTSVSISPNGRFLAVGETGYTPRVLIFSTAKDASPDVPLSILTEHTVGVRSLSFSPNSQYLATLGEVNDGFLFVWTVSLKSGSAKLHSTNKCINIVRHMGWTGQSLVTVGVRHVKVWRLPEARPVSPSKSRLNADPAISSPGLAPKALSGRNCLLGPFGTCVFTCVAGISDSEAVVGTEDGALCLLDDSEVSPRLTLIKYVGFGISSLTIDPDHGYLWVGGREKRMQRFSLESLRPTSPISPEPSGRISASKKAKGPAITCMGSLGSHLVTVNSSKEIQIHPVEPISNDCEKPLAIAAHRDAVLGIFPLPDLNELQANFFTWSSNGTVNFWDTKGRCKDSRTVTVDQPLGSDENQTNELKILRATQDLKLFVSGDKMGVLRVLSGQSWKCVNQIRAHEAEITDVALHLDSESCLIASSGRDRMVQLFRSTEESLELVQTMDDHVGSVNQLLFVKNGEKLLSCSSDRTVFIRERMTRETGGETAVAYLASRAVTLKASPVSMTLSTEDPNILIISTVDRCIQQYDLDSGKHIRSFRTTDSDSSDTVVMTALSMASHLPGKSPTLLIGVASTDKSIRVYDMEREALLTAEFGHAEGVSDVCLLTRDSECTGKPSSRTLVSAGIDGVVMIWDLLVQPQQSQDYTQNNLSEEEIDSMSKNLTVSKPPLRKILSKHELAGFQRQDNITGTPTPVRDSSQSLARKISKISLTPSSLKNEKSAPATPSPFSRSDRRSPPSHSRLQKLRKSPSPARRSTPGKKLSNTNNHARRISLDFRSRGRILSKSESGSLNSSTEQVCRTLKAYRKKLHTSTEPLHSHKELERELDLTLRVLAARPKTCGNVEIETDSSGKENDRKQNSLQSPHRMHSAPSLRQNGAYQRSRIVRSNDNGENSSE
ncbi:mitogen-activated protein kinase-binding protein 1 [Aspergillus udagawae]|uniref:Mitogen-activated protein kinase-binding protein 1 n=1 Tax=Aspergillus udagawae TaxID=91492 RepID=A0A8H3P9P9_9EURO|nr:mitogen-activated protein kinase-binding protein 1 [Aspergillus udagawae]